MTANIQVLAGDKVFYQIKRGHDSKDDEPEPEHDVDLLVDYVQGQDAHGVVPLNCSGGTIFVEGALGDSVRQKQTLFQKGGS